MTNTRAPRPYPVWLAKLARPKAARAPCRNPSQRAQRTARANREHREGDAALTGTGEACQTDNVRTYGVRFDVNCSILFTELPLLERPAAAKAAGFDGVEFWWPWDERPAPADKEADAFIDAVADAGVELVSLNFLTGDM